MSAQEIVLDALELAADEREKFIEAQCAGDEILLAEVFRYLSKYSAAEDFFEDAARPLEEFCHLVEAKPGDAIGPYTLIEPIGEGGFGVVWKAAQEEPMKRLVALKLIKAGMDTREVLARFAAERQALARMEHPNIARVYDAGATAAGRPYFVMELVDGIPITEFCDRHKLSIRDRIALVTWVCEAIGHAHKKGVIHRDIKPSNILVARTGNPVVKVIDFGVAKAFEGKLTDLTLHTIAEQLVGTPHCMSPEQAGMGGVEIDARTDIYGIGALFYELLCGVSPFDFAGKELWEIRRIIRQIDPLRPSLRLQQIRPKQAIEIAKNRKLTVKTLRKALRSELDWIVLKALEKKPERRYDSTDALAWDLLLYHEDKPVGARPPSAPYVIGKFFHRHWTLCVTVFVFGLLLVASVVTTAWITHRSIGSLFSQETSSEELPAPVLPMLDESDGDDPDSSEAMMTEAAVWEHALPEPTGPRHLSEWIDMDTAWCFLDDHFDPPENSQFYWNGRMANLFENGVLILRGERVRAWGTYFLAYNNFVCEVVASTEGDYHRGWGFMIYGTRVGHPNSIALRNGVEMLLDSVGNLSILPCRYVRPDQIDIEPIGPIPIPWFKPGEDNSISAIFTDTNTLQVFVNGLEAHEPIQLPYRLDPALLQIASKGGTSESSLAKIKSFRVFSMTHKQQ